MELIGFLIGGLVALVVLGCMVGLVIFLCVALGEGLKWTFMTTASVAGQLAHRGQRRQQSGAPGNEVTASAAPTSRGDETAPAADQ